MSERVYEHEIPMGQIQPPPHQLRQTIDPEALGRLADDIAVRGLLQGIGVVRAVDEDSFTIGYGHRRFLAHGLLGRATIRARVYPPGTDLLDIAIAENEFRKDLNPIEDARAMRQLIERGEPVPHIARRYRVSEATVRARLGLLDLPEDLQEGIAGGRLSVAVASALAVVDHDDYRASLIAEAQRNGASARVVAVWTAHYHADRDRIVANHLTVAAIVERREAFIVYVPCDACKEPKPYTETRGMRFCNDCAGELLAALSGAAASG